MGGACISKSCCFEEESPSEYMDRIEKRNRGIMMKGNKVDIMGISMHTAMKKFTNIVGYSEEMDEDYNENEKLR